MLRKARAAARVGRSTRRVVSVRPDRRLMISILIVVYMVYCFYGVKFGLWARSACRVVLTVEQFYRKLSQGVGGLAAYLALC